MMSFRAIAYNFFSFLSLFLVAEAFVSSETKYFGVKHYQHQSLKQPSRLVLNAKKGNKNKKRPSTAGFGGAAVEKCPCGSDDAYMKCCGKLHKDEKAYASATCEQVVRARYSAYAKREIDFIIGSTHPLNKDFMTDIEHWRKQIDLNCYDNFLLTSCEILNESYEGEGLEEKGTVQFVATMIQKDSKEKTAFMETSSFERAGKQIRNGAWLYKSGVVEPPPGREDYRIPDDEEASTSEMATEEVSENS
mmetsp:Transcript_8316/g.12758  ORF Transcript_8316/g.12758 Transcript_8316/m.12758 type:complete len:248 (-) Transcript_8316:51-794(-)